MSSERNKSPQGKNHWDPQSWNLRKVTSLLGLSLHPESGSRSKQTPVAVVVMVHSGLLGFPSPPCSTLCCGIRGHGEKPCSCPSGCGGNLYISSDCLATGCSMHAESWAFLHCGPAQCHARSLDSLSLDIWGLVLLTGASLVALVVKNPPASAGDIRGVGLIPGWERSPGGGHANTLQYSCLESSRDRGGWWATVTRSRTWLKQLSTHAHTTHRWPCWHLTRHLWSICGAKSKFLGPHKVLTWSSLSRASGNCSGHCRESWPLLAGWEALSSRAALKNALGDEEGRQGTWWRKKDLH